VHRIKDPAQGEHGQPKSDNADCVRLSWPGERFERRQDLGILDRTFHPQLPLRHVAPKRAGIGS